ncbi:hypothetical protein EYV94_05400 [Puteibacter caeruleilacunae]|nr:hypothetical protein EYV94_05400 [Puteibacter caeruleilacunae]
MKPKKQKRQRTALTILKVLATFAAIFYFWVVLDEVIPPYDSNMYESTLGIIMIPVLFVFFMVGYVYMWKNSFLGGLLFTLWYIGLVCVSLFIWVHGNVTILAGLPILQLGILLMIFSRKKR